jgi:hypothetical protein
VLGKVERVLPAATRAHIQAVEQTVAFNRGEAPTAPAGLAVLVLSSAISADGGSCCTIVRRVPN